MPPTTIFAVREDSPHEPDGFRRTWIPVRHDASDEHEIGRLPGPKLCLHLLPRSAITSEPLQRPLKRPRTCGLFLDKGGPPVLFPFLFSLFQTVKKSKLHSVLPENGPHIEESQGSRPEAVGRYVIDGWVDQENLQTPFHVLLFRMMEAPCPRDSPECFT